MNHQFESIATEPKFHQNLEKDFTLVIMERSCYKDFTFVIMERSCYKDFTFVIMERSCCTALKSWPAAKVVDYGGKGKVKGRRCDAI